MYSNIYDLISTYVFDNAIEVGSHAELVCTLVATLGCIVFVALPFYIVYTIIRRFI